ncbi:MAG: hypothetical protein JNL53_06670 [Cyclobacteriaceae bacterium]|nr:hypothetical protein [Cyclobacteriaceae bacterium]
MKRVISLSLALVVLSALSCSEEIVPTPYTYTKVFTGENSKTWKIKLLEETFEGKVIDRFTLSCAADDKYTFYANSEHTMEVLTGTLKCDSTEPALITDVWTFSNASATLTMLLPFFSVNFTTPLIVRAADDDEMELEIFFDEENTGSYRIHFEVIDQD